MIGSMVGASVWLIAFTVLSACSSGTPANGPGDAGGVDASADAPVAPPGDGGITAPDAPVDAAPGGDDPFPADPQGGEFAWVVSAPGAGDLVSTAVDGLGNIVVAARQTGEVTLGTVRVPGPASGEAVVVLKL